MSLRHEEAGDGASSIAVTSTVAVGIGHEGSGNEARCSEESSDVAMGSLRGMAIVDASILTVDGETSTDDLVDGVALLSEACDAASGEAWC